MNELIKLNETKINDELVQTVNARELHKFLEVTERFSSWMERQFQYGFEENVDYLGCKVFNTQANQELQDYYLSLDCAKEIAMLQKSDKGKQARKYFIECEKKLREHRAKPMTQIELIALIANQMAEQERKSLELDNRLQVVEQKQQQLNQDNDHFTIKGFCSLHKIDLSNGKMSALSKKAKKLSEVKEYAYHEISDPRWGKVKCYHIDILTELFEFEKLI